MTKSSATENDYVKFIANAVAMPAYGSSLQINMHTADPGKAGTATTSEPTYTAYAAQTVARDGTGFVICDKTTPFAANANGGAFKNDDLILFPEYEGGFVGTETITHVSVSVVATGQILRKAALLAPRTFAAGTAPLFAPGELVFAED
jgi:hypothetical protein